VTVLYRSELAEVHQGRAEDVLATLATESVALVVTDPPYGVEWVSNRRRRGRTRRAWRTRRYQNRHLYVFGPADLLEGLKVAPPVELVWDKGTMSGGDLTAPFGPAHERISFAVSKHRHPGQIGQDALPARIRKGSVLQFTRPTGLQVRHPTEKPVALLRELVLDPFAGVGSTGVAAILSGRRTLLVELDDHYARVAVDRVRRAEALAAQAANI
jgi:16S rRNA G966 N2-methylase RsmD